MKYYTLIPGPNIWVTSWTEFYNGTFGEQSLSFPTHGFTATWDNGTHITQGELALKTDLPTKTSDLLNNSGFITSADVPTPSYIEDTIGNKIEADLDCYSANLLSPWFFTSNQYTYDPTTQKWIWIEPGMGLEKQELTFYSEYNSWSLKFFSR